MLLSKWVNAEVCQRYEKEKSTESRKEVLINLVEENDDPLESESGKIRESKKDKTAK
jgi:hypothetical protein